MTRECRRERAIATPRLEREAPGADEEIVVLGCALSREGVADLEVRAQRIRQRNRAGCGSLVLGEPKRGDQQGEERDRKVTLQHGVASLQLQNNCRPGNSLNHTTCK